MISPSCSLSLSLHRTVTVGSAAGSGILMGVGISLAFSAASWNAASLSPNRTSDTAAVCPSKEEEQRRNRREVYYGKDANARSQRSRRRHIYLFNPEDMDNADIISMVENSPTYLRDKSTLNSIKMKAEQEGQLATEAAQEAEGGAGGVITF